MKTNYIKLYHTLLKISVLVFALCTNITVYAQVDEEVNDSIKTGYSQGEIKLNNPPSIIEAYTYDPVTDRYIYTNSVDGFNINYPIILTPEEYSNLILKESMNSYFKKKNDAIDGVKEGSEKAKKDLLPRYYIKSGLFESIFGSNTIDVKPTGSVEIDLGVRYSKQDNPALSPRNRSTTSFDFDQRISIGLQGKVGTRLSVNANYDTESTFAFQNLFKLEYAPTEDDIIQKIEVGNVSLPLNSSLIRGAQSLFGVKAQLQFGKTTVTGVFSEQKSQTKTVTAQGGGTVQDFELFALDYDVDRHFFLSQYFRNKYDSALKGYPFINSRVQINRLEVWITNRQNRVNTTNNNVRNIVALQDLGESQVTDIPDLEIVGDKSLLISNFFTAPIDSPADNKNNRYNPNYLSPNPPDDTPPGTGILNLDIREIATISTGFTGFSTQPNEGQDYSKLENARKLNPNEYTFNPQLGYLSLQQRLANDEVLGVAYQYTIGDKVYQVGEFGNDGVAATTTGPVNPSTNQPDVVSSQTLIVKMLKSSLTSVISPIWNLMMKNIYQIPGAYQLEQEDFKFNILYTDPSPLNYITPVIGSSFPANPSPENRLAETPLLKVFNVDKLNYNNDPQAGGDGFFDYLQGLTVDSQNGRLIFTTVEPFGKLLFEKLRTSTTENYKETGNLTSTFNVNQKKYVFRNLYRQSQATALQESDKNKFQLRGKFKSTGGDGIPIGAFNVPKGSVVVTAGGRVLQEGIDYSVNYQAGRVQILDPALQASNTPIQVSVENNSVFGQQTRRFMGVNVEHKFSDKFLLGATFLKMSERPLTQKSTYGQESVNNTIFGFNTNYATEVPFLTRFANMLPNMDTDAPSNFSARGEVAFLKPGTPKADRFEGESTIYVDDFEGSQSTIDLRSPQSWNLSSTPVKNPTTTSYPDFGAGETGLDVLKYGFKRAKLSWYTIDPIFYSNQKPDDLAPAQLSTNKTRRIFSKELYPVTDIAVGQSQVINTLDLTYYPKERGPYNNNPDAIGNNMPAPQNNFGGITRALNSTNFEQQNVEYIQFWMLDPYTDSGNPTSQSNATNTGKIFFNLGAISEDVLKDGRKQYENGLPEAGSNQLTTTTAWGKVPQSQSLLYAFDTNESNRTIQDVGFDGLTNGDEVSKYSNFASAEDPAADDYTYFLNASGTLLDRYKNYNGTQGNSPINVTNTNRGNTTIPDVEDLNRDNTMDEINAYYEYSIDLQPNMQVGVTKYVTDIIPVEVPAGDVPTGNPTTARWIQFKIPVSKPENTVGGIADFKSIRFMRMFMTGFSEEMTIRFGALDLVRGEWRRYENTLDTFLPDIDPLDAGTVFDVQGINIEENGTRYVSPPGVIREQLLNNNTVINQNEQSLSLRAAGPDGLEEGDSRAVFKNLSVDMRQFKKLKMFLHAEQVGSEVLQDNEMAAFIRFGNDLSENFYQIEIPLKVTAPNASLATDKWPAENNIDLEMDLLTQIKIQAKGILLGENEIYYKPLDANSTRKLKIGVRGNPNFGLVRTLMVGIKNNTKTPSDPGKKISGEVWFNELRLSDQDNEGGMAAVLSIDGNIADLATISATGKLSTIGFGTIEQGPNERSREDIKQYNIVSNISLGKLLPKKWGINLPFNYSIGEETITPEYDPFNQDIRLKQLIDVTADQAERNNIANRAIDYTKRQSINFIGVKKERGEKQKPHIYDPENLTLSYSYNKEQRHNYEIESYTDQQVTTTVDYAFSLQPKPIEPFKNSKFFKKSEYWKLLSDFNFNYLPTAINFSSNINRQFNKQQFRQVEVIGLPLDALYRRNFLFNYQYGFNYNLTKTLKFNFTASSSNIISNYLNQQNEPNNSYTIWDDYWNTGDPNQHNQQLVVNYDLPINKIPFLSFIKSSYTYTGDYNWQKASQALQEVEVGTEKFNLGNTIQNAGSHKLNATFNMDAFYKYIGLTKGAKKTPKPKATAPPKPGEKIVNNAPKPAEASKSIFVTGLIGILTSVKNIQGNYIQNKGTVLPGYVPGIGFFGSSKPTLGFVFGSQEDVRFEAAKNGYLTNYPDFNQNFTQISTKTLNFTANADLFPDFKIDFTADRTYAQNYSEQYDVSNGQYNSRSPYNTGNFAISTTMLKTAFKRSDDVVSAPFEDFKNNRIIIANRLALQNGLDPSLPANQDADGFPAGYGKNSQAVLIPSFLAAYTGFISGKNGAKAKVVSFDTFRNIPIPNLIIKYSGFMKYKLFKDRFKRFSFQSNYKSSYTINAFRSNLEYDKTPNGKDAGGNFLNKVIIGNINLVEQISPFRIDLELKSSVKILAEMKKDRALSMSFDNNLLTEVKGIDYIIGLGYRIKDVSFTTKLADTPSGIIKSDINIKADVTYRNSQTIVRNLDYNNNQLSGGQNVWSAKLTADYSFSKNFTAIFYYDHSFSRAVISTSFPITNIRSGFTLRYNFGN